MNGIYENETDQRVEALRMAIEVYAKFSSNWNVADIVATATIFAKFIKGDK